MKKILFYIFCCLTFQGFGQANFVGGGGTANVRYGISTPTILGSDKKGDEYFRTSTGDNTVLSTESYLFDGTQWNVRPSTALVREGGSVILNNQVFNTNTFVNSTNGMFTIPSAGTWKLSYYLSTDGTGANANNQFQIVDAVGTVVEGSQKTRGGSSTSTESLPASPPDIVTSGPTTFYLQGRNGGSGSATILNTVAHKSTILWEKTSGFLSATVLGNVFYKQCQVIDKLQSSTADEGDLILLNGRLKSTLTAAQQAVATACGYGTNLFDGVGKMLVGSGSGFTPLTAGGSATSIIGLANLPNINLSGGNHGHSVTDPNHSHPSGTLFPQFNYQNFIGAGGSGLTGSSFTANSSAGGGFYNGSMGGSTASVATGISIVTSGNLTIPLGGSGTAISTQNPYGVVAKYVYLGAANPVVTASQALSLTTTGTGASTFNSGTGILNIPNESATVALINGIVKSNGIAISSAVAGTDYVLPSGNITGNAATVTTNANLTGDVTSVGNATTIGALKVLNANIANATIDLTTKVTGVLPIANGGTGSATQNFVDLSTNQTVLGNKTFNGNTVMGSVSGNNTAIGNALTTSSNTISAGATGTTVLNQNGTERMRLHTNGNVGIGTITPTSTFELIGSLGTKSISTAVAAYTLLANDYNVNLTLAGLQTVTYTTVVSSLNREYRIVNPTTTVKSFAAVVTGMDGVTTTVIPARSWMRMQCNGAIWRIVETGILINDQSSLNFCDVGGMRMQWGRATTSGLTTVNFPASFANTNYSITGNAMNGGASTSLIQVPMFNALSTTQFTFTHTFINVAGALPASNNGQPISWIAVGQKP